MRRLQDLMRLDGQIAVLTGGAGRIAGGFASALTDLGAHVCLLDVAAPRLAARLAELAADGRHAASAWTLDVGDEGEVAATIAAIQERFGRLDILINNAAYPPTGLPADGLALSDQSLGQWEANLQVMLTGTFLITRACQPALAASGRGRIVNIASIYGLVGPDPGLYAGTPMANEAHYAASKGGIVQLTRYWATLLAPAIRVNAIAPGGLAADQPQAFVERYVARTPLGRMAGIEDLIGALAYFATDLSAYVTGQVLAVDGGWTAW